MSYVPKDTQEGSPSPHSLPAVRTVFTPFVMECSYVLDTQSMAKLSQATLAKSAEGSVSNACQHCPRDVPNGSTSVFSLPPAPLAHEHSPVGPNQTYRS